MAQVEITSESQMPNGWAFEAQVLDDVGVLRRHCVTLSWADYNLWSRSGSDVPAKVAEAALSFLLSRLKPDEVPPRFDASMLRRRFPGVDAEIPQLIQP